MLTDDNTTCYPRWHP